MDYRFDEIQNGDQSTTDQPVTPKEEVTETPEAPKEEAPETPEAPKEEAPVEEPPAM